MAVNREQFALALEPLDKVGLDSSLLIYHLEDIMPYADLTEMTFAALGEGRLTAVLSTITVTELLVQPFALAQDDRVAACEHFIQSLPNTTLVAPDYNLAKASARLRATYNLRTPDAILIATALYAQANAFITNDIRLRRLAAEGLEIIILEDYT